jgi:release factor glutamine methyltransferase
MTDFILEKAIEQKLKSAGIESARFEARQILGASKTPDQAKQMAEKRLKGYPLQYILGEWEFYGKRILVGDGVLIPRADTETLVDVVKELWRDNKAPEIFDVCAGSGCIGIALQSITGGHAIFFEKEKKAIEYLKKNIEINGTNAKIVETDVLTADLKDFKETADIIVSNPPYIKTEILPTLQREVQFEPKTALDGGQDGLIFYRTIAKIWKSVLKKGGILAFEIGFDQSLQVKDILEQNGYSEIKVTNDLGNNPRVVTAVK